MTINVKIIVITACIIFSCVAKSYGQEMEKEINFVISIDSEIAISIANPKISIKDNNQVEQIAISYIPGELIMDNADFNRIMQSQKNQLILTFDYYENSRERQKVYSYEIVLERVWFEQSFRVLRIYNLDKKVNSKIFYPLEGKEYTYEIDLPSNSITRIRKNK